MITVKKLLVAVLLDALIYFSPPHSPPHLFWQLRYTQVALTQDTDSDSYTHRPVYPPCKRFFIEPKAAASAIKCNITVVDSQQELCRLLVVPFSPKRGKQERFLDGQLGQSWGISMQKWRGRPGISHYVRRQCLPKYIYRGRQGVQMILRPISMPVYASWSL